MLILNGVVIMPNVTSHLDIVGDSAAAAVDYAVKNGGSIFLVTAKKPYSNDEELPVLYDIGVEAKIKQVLKLPNKNMRVHLETKSRARLVDFYREDDNFYCADIEMVEEPANDIEEREIEPIGRMITEKLQMAFSIGMVKNKALYKQLLLVRDLSELSNAVIEFIPMPYKKKQELLEELSLRERIMKLISIIDEEAEIISIRREIDSKLKDCVNKHQREFMLREQMRLIRKELGEDESAAKMADVYLEKLGKLSASDEVIEKLEKEITRYRNMPPQSGELNVISNYIETLLDYPWGKVSNENDDLKKAIKILEEDHYGLDEVKERIIDYLAVRILSSKGNMPIICLVGPPGTGKTSIARSIAKATGKEYTRMSLGGVRDEAEIRGHRRTYIGAMPGRIAQAVSKTKTENPLVLLDEIDKVSSDYKGDVSSALLEVLDSEQNSKFADHYFDVPIDLSKVMFIATANDASHIPGPLLDRMELIEISGYTANEKFNIAKQYLVRKAIEKNGLTNKQIKINDGAIKYIIKHYTKEAGVRDLERHIDKVCRKVCRTILTEKENAVKVTKDNVAEMLGTEKYTGENENLSNKVGSVRGLAWTAVGGVTLDIEVNVMKGAGKLQLTGKLGDVMKESAITGLSYIRTLDETKRLGEDFFEKHDIHIHIPEGAVPKDGPSAGITMATALYSAIFEKKVSGKIAMTGEVTLRGNVLPIGGLKEKLLAAKSIGIKTVLIPERNERDLKDISSEITGGLEIIPVENMDEVLSIALVK